MELELECNGFRDNLPREGDVAAHPPPQGKAEESQEVGLQSNASWAMETKASLSPGVEFRCEGINKDSA